MPRRYVPIYTGEIYHIYNRGIDKRPVFLQKREYDRAILTLRYYRHASPSLRLSIFLTLSLEARELFLERLRLHNPAIVTILSFCLMPNHYHLLVRQEVDRGIAQFISKVQNSYTKYFNTKHKRDGALYSNQFKAVRIESEEQLLHISRYIHINPYTGFICKNLHETVMYPWSSLGSYVGNTSFDWIDTSIVLSQFSSKKSYLRFVDDQKDYQRRLAGIQHLTFE